APMSAPDDFRLWRMSKIDEWRSNAFSLGGPMGNVLSRSFDLIHTVMRDGVADERSLGYALESLQRERELAITRDTERDDGLRRLVYGLTESMGAMLECIVEDNHAAPGAAMMVDPAAADEGSAALDPAAERINAASESDNGFLKEEEPMEELFDSTLEDQGKQEDPEEITNPDEDDPSQKESADSSIDDDLPCSSQQETSKSSRSVSERGEAQSGKRARTKNDDDDEWRSITASTQLRPRTYLPNSCRSTRRSCVSGMKKYFDSDGEEVEGYYDFEAEDDFECTECER
ncbi:hypothetical protein PMAYCL1PPCAC_01623, partial [Pristionchus mayeri]